MRGQDFLTGGVLEPAFRLVEPVAAMTPLVFDSPHSGDRYPRAFLAASRLDPFTLRRSEDAFVDRFAEDAARVCGAPVLCAGFPRAYLDLNREPFELDPRMFVDRTPDFANTRSLRVAGGLGTIPRVVGDGLAIYREPFSVEDALARIRALYVPYHQRLRALLDRAHSAFGCVVLVDLHSMPSATHDGPTPDFVLGDRYGTSATSWVVDVFERVLASRGRSVRRNKPYAGGFICEHYGAPAEGRHAVQIEINRANYMDEAGLRPTGGLEVVSRDISAAAAALAEEALRQMHRYSAAAE